MAARFEALIIRHGRRTSLVLFAIAVLTSFGCSTHADRVRDARTAYFANDLPAASVMLQEAAEAKPRERDCLLLDRAMISLAQGDPESAEALLRDVRNQFDYLEQKNIAESSLAMFTDETVLAYAGEDYEKVMIRAMLAISNLMGDGGDAVAYCLQVEEKQRAINERRVANAAQGVPPQIANVAVGAYLRGIVQEASHTNYDDAERSFALVASWEPRFDAAKFDLNRARSGVHSAPGNGVVYLFALVGRGPYKEEGVAVATSNALLIADRILSAVGDHTLPPTIAPVKVPVVVVPTNSVDAVAVDVDGHPAALTQTVTDVGRLARLQYKADRPQRIADAVVRRVLKKATIYTAKDSLDVGNGLTNLAFDAAGVLWEATESADTRCWALLPETIQVLRLELPTGTHQLTLHPVHRGRPLDRAHTVNVEVMNGRNTYVLASYPTPELVGQILVSGRPSLANTQAP